MGKEEFKRVMHDLCSAYKVNVNIEEYFDALHMLANIKRALLMSVFVFTSFPSIRQLGDLSLKISGEIIKAENADKKTKLLSLANHLEKNPPRTRKEGGEVLGKIISLLGG